MSDKTLAYSVYELLKKQHCTVTTAESATGGMIAAALVNVPGISEVFKEGYITYANEAKIKLLGVSEETIAQFGVVSSQTAAEMADGAARIAGCEAAVSVTGVAGPDGGTPECPVGLVYIGCHLRDKTVTERHVFGGDRMQVRQAAEEAALLLLKKMLEEDGGMICES